MSRFYVLFALPVMATFAGAQTTCDHLKLSLPETSVTSIEFVAAGPFAATNAPATALAGAPLPAAPGGRGAGRGGLQGPAAAVPAYCRVKLVLIPSSDSLIEAAVFLPAETGMGNCKSSGMADGPAPSAIPQWRPRYAKATPRLRMTRATAPMTWAEAACSGWITPRRSPISRIAPCMRR